MLHASLIKSLEVNMPKSEARPSLKYIHMDDQGRYETTDSFSMTRVTPKVNLPTYPNTGSFWEKEPVYKIVDKAELQKACEVTLALVIKWNVPTLILNWKESKTSGNDYNFPNELGHSLPTWVDAKRLLVFLKSISKEKRPLEWYQKNPLAPLQFILLAEHGTIEYMLMPLKI